MTDLQLAKDLLTLAAALALLALAILFDPWAPRS